LKYEQRNLSDLNAKTAFKFTSVADLNVNLIKRFLYTQVSEQFLNGMHQHNLGYLVPVMLSWMEAYTQSPAEQRNWYRVAGCFG